MKHNEVKAYFKSKLKEKFTKYDVLSIDETLSRRNIYLVDKKTMKTIYYIDCFFGTDNYHVSVFKAKDKINKFKDVLIEAQGNYYQLDKLGKLIKDLNKSLVK